MLENHESQIASTTLSRRGFLLSVCLFFLPPIILLCQTLGGIRRYISQHRPVPPFLCSLFLSLFHLFLLALAKKCLPEVTFASSFPVHVIAIPEKQDELGWQAVAVASKVHWVGRGGSAATAGGGAEPDEVLSADFFFWERKTMLAITKKSITPATAPMIAPV